MTRANLFVRLAILIEMLKLINLIDKIGCGSDRYKREYYSKLKGVNLMLTIFLLVRFGKLSVKFTAFLVNYGS